VFQIRPDANKMMMLAELCCAVLWRQENQILKNRGPARGLTGAKDPNAPVQWMRTSYFFQKRERYFLPKARTWATSAVICSSESFPLKDGMYLPLPSCITSEIC